MTKFTPQDWVYAHAYQTMTEEQALPHAVQIKRARSLIAFYRQQIRHLVFHYRLWLADAEYNRITGHANTARSNPLFIATLRRAIGHYRQQQSISRDLCRRQKKSTVTGPHPDFAQMNDQQIYEYLEMTHGVYFAQQVLDEMQKAKQPKPKKAA